MTEFELKLKELFPEIYELHLLSKDEAGGEKHIWDLIDALLGMNRGNLTGSIIINYTKGRIDGIRVTTDLLAFKKAKPPIDNK